jgi:hypothetical protein
VFLSQTAEQGIKDSLLLTRRLIAVWTPPFSGCTGQLFADSMKERLDVTVQFVKRNELDVSPLSPKRWDGERTFG